MVISKSYARRLISKGKAREEGEVNDNGKKYMIITRFDVTKPGKGHVANVTGRTDHYLIEE